MSGRSGFRTGQYRNAASALALMTALTAPLAVPRPASADIFDGLEIFDSALDSISSGFDYLWPDALDLKDFSVRLGLGVGTTPDYIGSDEYKPRIIPLIDLRYKDLLVLQGPKLRYNLLRHKYVKAGPLINLFFGRDEKENAILTGLGNVKDAWQVGAFIESQYKGALVSAEFRQSLGNGQGAMARVILAHGLYKSEKVLVIVGARGEWNSAQSNQTNYGITPSQSLASLASGAGLPEYAPGAGVSNLGINLIGRYTFNKHWRIEAIAGYSTMLDGAADSPLVATYGDRDQAILGAGFRYTF